MGVLSIHPDALASLSPRPLSVQTAITFQTELPRRLVPSTPPCRFGLRVQGRLEFLSFQELITQAAVERLDEPVLPRMGRGHRDRLSPSLGQPLHQCLANELRAVVAAYPRGRPSPADHPRQHAPDIRSRQ